MFGELSLQVMNGRKYKDVEDNNFQTPKNTELPISNYLRKLSGDEEIVDIEVSPKKPKSKCSKCSKLVGLQMLIPGQDASPTQSCTPKEPSSFTPKTRKPHTHTRTAHNPYSLTDYTRMSSSELEEIRVHFEGEFELLEHLMGREYMIYQPPKIYLKKPKRIIPTGKTLILNLDSFIKLPEDLENMADIEHIIYTPYSEQPVYIRPYTTSFFQELRKKFEILLFSEYEWEFTSEILGEIFEGSIFSYIDHILTRAYCSILGDSCIWELFFIQNRAREDIYILHHRPTSWPYDLDRFMPLPPFLNLNTALLNRLIPIIKGFFPEGGEFMGLEVEKGAQGVIHRFVHNIYYK